MPKGTADFFFFLSNFLLAFSNNHVFFTGSTSVKHLCQFQGKRNIQISHESCSALPVGCQGPAHSVRLFQCAIAIEEISFWKPNIPSCCDWAFYNSSSRFPSADSRTIQSTHRHGSVRGEHMFSVHSSRELNRQQLAPAE